MTSQNKTRNRIVDFSELNDAELALNIQNGENIQESLRVLVDRHSGIYYSRVNRYLPERGKCASVNIDKDFLLNSRDLIIYEAAKNFNPNKNTKFSTYLGSTTNYFCLNHINKNKAYVSYETAELEDILKDSDYNEISLDIDENIINQVIDIIKNMEDDRIYKIFKLRYLDANGRRPTPWSKIEGKIPHINNKTKFLTIQGCINLHNKALSEIKKVLHEKGD